jgi:hypothetical protein
MSIWLVCSLPLCPWLKAQWKLPPLSWLGCSDSRSSSPPLQKCLAKNTLHMQWLKGIFSKPIIIVISCSNYTIPAHCEVAWWMQYAANSWRFSPFKSDQFFWAWFEAILLCVNSHHHSDVCFLEGYWGMILQLFEFEDMLPVSHGAKWDHTKPILVIQIRLGFQKLNAIFTYLLTKGATMETTQNAIVASFCCVCLQVHVVVSAAHTIVETWSQSVQPVPGQQLFSTVKTPLHCLYDLLVVHKKVPIKGKKQGAMLVKTFHLVHSFE